MKKFYESFCEIAQRNPNASLKIESNDLVKESQLLDSKPENVLMIGFIPMTGEGIESDVNDLDFVSANT